MSKLSTKNQEESFSDNENDDLSNNLIQVKDFDLKKFVLPSIDEKLSSPAQYHSFPKYKFGEDKKDLDNVVIVTNDIKLSKGGIPRLDPKFRRNDSKREFFYLGEDKDQDSCNDLFNLLQSIDEEFDKRISYDSKKDEDPNLESKTVFIQKDKKKDALNVLEYVPIVRLSQGPPEGSVQEGQAEYVPYKRIKVKFSTEYNKDKDENEPNKLTTALFLGDKNEPEDLTYPTDYEKYLRYGCTARFVLQINKFWCKKSVEKDKKGVQKPRECGFNIKVLQIIITKESTVGGGQSIQEKYRKRCVALKAGPSSASKNEAKQDVKETKKGESNSESESESDSDSEDEKQKKDTKPSKPPAKQEKKQTNKVESTSEESDSEDDSDSDNSSDSDSDSDSKKKPAKKADAKKSR